LVENYISGGKGHFKEKSYLFLVLVKFGPLEQIKWIHVLT